MEVRNSNILKLRKPKNIPESRSICGLCHVAILVLWMHACTCTCACTDLLV